MAKTIITILIAVTLLIGISYYLFSTRMLANGTKQSNLNYIKTSVSPLNPIFVEKYPKTVISTLWLDYSKKIQDDGRTLDRGRNLITTSEGQSYSMLRAVWMNDKDTFDRVWKWTKNNLQKRPEDNLFAWKWGQNPDGSWNILKEEGGINTATDADQDIALALIFASKRWNDDDYLEEAQKILNDIWRLEVININGKPYLTAGNWAVTENPVTLNPSYLSPAHYEIFAKVNPQNDWLALKDTSYEVLEYSTNNNLKDSSLSADLPPDWLAINPETGEFSVPRHSDKTTDFSDDAIRVPFRVGLDYTWFGDKRATEHLTNNYSTLLDQWNSKQRLDAGYKQGGQETVKYESLSTYGATLPYFMVADRDVAEQIYNNKLAVLYNPDTETFRVELNYYDQNWVWFGMAYYNNALENLYE